METKSIDERAREFANATIVKSTNFIVWNQVRLRYIDIATKQDSISRSEERERACKLYREGVLEIVHLIISSKDGRKVIDINDIVNKFRKAMEEGGE